MFWQTPFSVRGPRLSSSWDPKDIGGPPALWNRLSTVPFIRIFDPFQNSVTGFMPPVFCQQLPRIDAVVISHSHYDHLDAGSVSSLNARFGGTLRWYVCSVHLQWALINLPRPGKSHVISVWFQHVLLSCVNVPLQVCAPGFDGLADEDGLWECDRVRLVGRELRAGLWWHHICLHTLSALE